jgi:hypothetical protein
LSIPHCFEQASRHRSNSYLNNSHFLKPFFFLIFLTKS